MPREREREIEMVVLYFFSNMWEFLPICRSLNLVLINEGLDFCVKHL
jgi:hypothetical protein